MKTLKISTVDTPTKTSRIERDKNSCSASIKYLNFADIFMDYSYNPSPDIIFPGHEFKQPGDLKKVSANEINAIMQGAQPPQTFFSKDRKCYHIKDCLIDGDIIIQHNSILSLPELFFENCTFEGLVSFQGGIFSKQLSFQNCLFLNRVDIEGGTYKAVHFTRGCLLEGLTMDGGEFGELNFSITCYVLLEISAGKIGHLSVSSSSYKNPDYIEKLWFTLSYLEANISIQSLILNDLYFDGTLKKDKEIIIEDIHANILHIDTLVNEGKIRFFHLNKPVNGLPIHEKKFTIVNSNLGKAEFYNVDMNHFNYLYITRSVLIDCVFVNVKWPKDINRPLYPQLPVYLEKKETYRQIKYAYSKQGDSVAEHHFHALEMNTYLRYLATNIWLFKFTFSAYNRIWPDQLETYIVLLLSKWMSNYGQSFLLPLIWMLGIGIVLLIFLINMEAVPDIHYATANWSIKDILATFPVLLRFINPLHKNDPEFTGTAFVIDTMMRIFSSYFIYNIIRATRRFVK